jgi:hypothetical protein
MMAAFIIIIDLTTGAHHCGETRPARGARELSAACMVINSHRIRVDHDGPRAHGDARVLDADA